MGNLSNVKDSYKPTEWSLREAHYLAKLDEINIPADITTADIKILESLIDALYTEASVDLAYAQRKSESLDRSKKLLEKELFLIIKGQGISGLKTVDEVNGAIAVALKYISASDILAGKPIDVNVVTAAILNALGNGPAPVVQFTTLVQAQRIYEERVIFIEQIIDVLKTKHSTLITNEGALKLENDIARSGGSSH